jgi:predicted Zn finger-like uncharacterized protein
MNYITSCPACETQFLLNKEQLKAHRGKVQCGHCNEVFNAKNRLTEISDDITSTDEYNASIESQTGEALDTSSETVEANTATSPAQTSEVATDEAVDWDKGAVTEINIDSNDDSPIAEKLNVVLDFVPNLSDLDANSPYIGDISPSAYEAVAAYDDEAPIVIQDLTTAPKFSIDKPKFSYQLLLLSLLLAALAGLQATYYFRNKIAAEYPQFKPYLLQACEAMQCQVDLPRDLDFFTIDDSDMQEDESHQEVINFTSQLINGAGYTQTYPNIELTLTDADDQPALIRLVKPEEYLKPNADVAAGIGAHEEVRVKLAIHASGLPVAGYRVLLVY